MTPSKPRHDRCRTRASLWILMTSAVPGPQNPPRAAHRLHSASPRMYSPGRGFLFLDSEWGRTKAGRAIAHLARGEPFVPHLFVIWARRELSITWPTSVGT